jgi:hypothetical protein
MRNKAVVALCALGFITCCANPASASVIITLEQVGSNVVATGSGSLDTTDLMKVPSGSLPALTYPSLAVLLIGGGSSYDGYENGISGPASFGSAGGTYASSSTGDYIGIEGSPAGEIAVPHGYTSGTPLAGTATFDSTTLAALGVTIGTYTWTWGTGSDADSLTVYAGVPAPTTAPEPASISLLALGLAGGVWLKTRKHDSRL